MAVQRTSVLISYNDDKKGPLDQDLALANQLAIFLQQNGKDAEVKGYSSSTLNIDVHQWLILIPSPEITSSPQMSKVVDDALDQVIKRRMKGVLAVSASTSDLPSKWATIRKFDANEPSELKVALAGVLSAMQYAKITYPEAQSQAAFVASQKKKLLLARLRNALLVAVIIGLLIILSREVWFEMGFSTSRITLSPSKLTATAQARSNTQATQTALATTPQISPTVLPNATQQAMQKEYDNITGKQPTILGFRTGEQWSMTEPGPTSCILVNSTYTVSIQNNHQYLRCMATNTKFTNFALQVTMTITGDAGGIIFRDDGNGTYYRLAFNQSATNLSGTDGYSVFLCSSNICDTPIPDIGNVSTGTELTHSGATVEANQNQPMTFTIIVQNNNIDLFINGTFQIHVTAPTSNTSTLQGQIGLFAASLGNPTNVTFTNMKVWSLDKP